MVYFDDAILALLCLTQQEIIREQQEVIADLRATVLQVANRLADAAEVLGRCAERKEGRNWSQRKERMRETH